MIYEDAAPDELDGSVFSKSFAYCGGVIYIITGLFIFVDWYSRHTVLLAPVDQNFHAAMSSAGVFIGIIFAALIRDCWIFGFGLFGTAPKGISAIVQLSVLVGASYFAGGYVADAWVEWRAFHGITPVSREEAFYISKYDRRRRAPSTLNLRNAAGSMIFTIDCGITSCLGIYAGNWIAVKIETGRSGIQRASLPINPKTLAAPGLPVSQSDRVPS